MPLTRTDFQQLADIRAAEAAALLAAGCWDGAYYLAGYAVECALKACVAKTTVAEEFPDKKRATQAYTHDLDDLFGLARLRDERNATAKSDLKFSESWDKVKAWAEDARYERWTEGQARGLLTAVVEPTYGVLQWIKSRW